jgi:hypothetical protein
LVGVGVYGGGAFQEARMVAFRILTLCLGIRSLEAVTKTRSHECERCTQECVRHGLGRWSTGVDRVEKLRPSGRLAG